MDNRFALKKQERISHKRDIDRLFKEGSAYISHPLRVIYLEQNPLPKSTVSIIVSVSKKKFKHAVKRNRMKRLIREAYRLNKSSLIQRCLEKDYSLLIAFLFIGNELSRWKDMETAMQKSLGILMEKIA